jgi:putative aminopeptidase FrvX
MSQTSDFLKELISMPGLSGYEAPVRERISAAWKPLVDELAVSKLGSLHGLRRGTAAEPRARILLAAHMDAIGMMATSINQGLIYFTEIGSLDPRILPGQQVMVHGREDLPGVIVQPSDKLLPSDLNGKPVPMKYLMVDTGLDPKDVVKLVSVGDLISFGQLPIELGEDILVGHSMDNRASVAAVTYCLQVLKPSRHAWDVWAVATVQEEEALGGALTSTFDIRPDLAIAVDVTFAKGPGSSDWRTFPQGKGPTIGWGPNIHPALTKSFKELAGKLDIPYHLEVSPRHSGTDAIGIQITAEGVPCMVLGIPLRYMHTPVEVVSLKDIERTGRLMAEFILALEPEYVNQIQWQDNSPAPWQDNSPAPRED